MVEYLLVFIEFGVVVRNDVVVGFVIVGFVLSGGVIIVNEEVERMIFILYFWDLYFCNLSDIVFVEVKFLIFYFLV